METLASQIRSLRDVGAWDDGDVFVPEGALDAFYAGCPNVEVRRRALWRYEVPQSDRMRLFGLGCVCSDSDGVCDCGESRARDFVPVSSVRASEVPDVPVYGMTLREYDEWWEASEAEAVGVLLADGSRYEEFVAEVDDGAYMVV
jgi:hypothetical protein